MATNSITKALVLTGLALIALSGCKTTEPTYYYGEYQKAVYGYFKADEMSVSQQIDVLVQVIQQAESKGKPVAPGVHAHLGMLYFEAGQSDLGLLHFETEKSLFPESAQYVDFLLSAANGVDA